MIAKREENLLETLSNIGGLLNLSGLEPELSVPFSTKPIKGANIVWLNRRWLACNGADINNEAEIHQIKCELLEQYAVEATDETSLSASRMLADRYGASGGSRIGGSGRCGYRGSYNAKGIGRTPLSSSRVSWSYSNGMFFLSEALREAVLGEVLSQALAHGSVPVIAIIDTGRNSSINEIGTETERRAIVVRPNFLRPSHAERSIFFGDAGFYGSAQESDVRRVRAVVSLLTSPDKKRAANLQFKNMEVAFYRIGEQIGSGWANKMWMGRYITSNISLTGQIVDFGSCRSSPSWRRVIGDVGQEFGAEFNDMLPGAISLCRYLDQYAPDNYDVPQPYRLMDKLRSGADASFKDACSLALFGRLQHSQQEISLVDQLYQAFLQAQKESVFTDDEEKHILGYQSVSIPALDAHLGLNSRQNVLKLSLEIERKEKLPKGTLSERLCRWLEPQRLLYWRRASRLASALSRNIALIDRHANDLDRYVNFALAKCAKFWPTPPWFRVDARMHCNPGYVLIGVDVRSGRDLVFAILPRFENIAFIQQKSIYINNLANSSCSLNDHSVSVFLNVYEENGKKGIQLGGSFLAIEV